jgi:hypothetical protein
MEKPKRGNDIDKEKEATKKQEKPERNSAVGIPRNR